MQYTYEQFIEDVKAEAKALREHATKKELDKLDVDEFDPRHHSNCIYGLMTGSCFSSRASTLIFACCQRYFADVIEDKEDGYEICSHDLSDALKFANGNKIEGIDSLEEFHKEVRDEKSQMHYSTIEAYISILNARNADLIAYLRGETDELILV